MLPAALVAFRLRTGVSGVMKIAEPGDPSVSYSHSSVRSPASPS